MQNVVRSCQKLKAGTAIVAMAVLLAGCEKTGGASAGATPSRPSAAGAATVGRDVERPDIFSVSEKALWDGRPSLGGVWVAYPENVDPERVIIRNIDNGKSVIGALFRRERENPGPAIQLSSDAAAALGVIAGSPTEISIVVLRRDAVEVETPEAPQAQTDPNMTLPARRGAVVAPVPAVPSPAAQATGAGIAAIVEQTLAEVPAATAASGAPEAVQPSHPLFPLKKPYIQVGTFSEQANAQELISTLAAEGVQAQVQADNPENPTLWRVVSGPYAQRKERTAQLRIIKGLGFTDAFFFK